MAKPTTKGRRLDLEVTREMIAEGKKKDSSHCVVAEAIKAAVPTAANVSVDLATIRFSDRKRGKRYVYLTPAVAQQALIDFDQGRKLVPFTFRMRMAQVTQITRSSRHARNGTARPSARGAAKLKRSSSSTTPVKVGGALPPVAVLSNARGRVREFGLRQLRP